MQRDCSGVGGVPIAASWPDCVEEEIVKVDLEYPSKLVWEGLAGLACEDEESKWLEGWLKNGVPSIGWPVV